MKIAAALSCLLVSGASAFQPPMMTFAVGKAPPKAKAVVKKVQKAAKSIPSATKAVKAVKKAPQVKKAVAVAKKAVAPVKKVERKAKATVAKVKASIPKPAVVRGKVARAIPQTVRSIPSQAIPYENAPALLDGSLVGDVGFDPCYLSTKADLLTNYFNGIFNNQVNIDGITWYREAELMHGRICMVAVLGFIVPGFATFPGNAWTGVDAYSATNPLEAWNAAPSAALFQIFAFMSCLEFRRIRIILSQGSNYMAGDSQRWGQGPGRWNPLGLDYTPAEYEEKQLQEIKHARLAMIGFLGLVFQANASGVNVVQQWSQAFVIPEYVGKAGYYFPEGI
jgi:hypothetical protein